MKEFLDKHGLNASVLKWIAIIVMILNHFCYVMNAYVGTVCDAFNQYFFTEAHWYLSRLGFVIFAFQITEGMFYTKNRLKYILYLFVFALISEPIYNLCFSHKLFDFESCCVLWTLGLAATTIAVIDKYERKPLPTIIITLLACTIGFMMGAEYSIIGIPMMVLFYLFRNVKWKALTFGAIAFMVGSILEFLFSYMQSGISFTDIMQNAHFWKIVFEEWHGLLAWPIFLLYNGKKGKNINKWFFYGFYPGHLLILYLLSLLLVAIL